MKARRVMTKKIERINVYKSFERKDANVSALRKLDVDTINVDKLLTLKNQSQLIDAVKHAIIDKSLKNSVDKTKIVNAVTTFITSDEKLVSAFFSHAKYSKADAILNRIKDHLSCDSRHSETRFDKRQAAIVSVLK
jgi:hypothetical protein